MNHTYDLCPVCHNKKSVVSKVCQKCRFVDSRVVSGEAYLEVTDFWASQFTGLFMGEGSALIVKNRGDTFTCVISLGLRADDILILENIQAHLGGTIINIAKSKTFVNAAPQLAWKVTGLEQVLVICDLLLHYSTLPSKKTKDIQAVYDFCEWRIPNKRKHISDDDREEMRRRYDESIRARMYSL